VAAAVGLALVRPTWRRPGVARGRVAGYVLAGMAAAALLGPGLVLVLLGCGALELALRAGLPRGAAALHPAALLAASASTAGLAWTALKVGALSYGGGFVIVPLMQDDAIDRHGWMTEREFLDAVALGQITPGPVLHTVAAVGYAAAGVGGALLAAAIAFAPSFAFVLAGAGRFDRLLADARVRAFIDGAAPAALGAILGSAVPLALLLSEPWQAALLGVAMAALLVARRGVVEALLGAGVAGAALVLLGAPVP
jgi:chromate transporter